MNDLWKSTYPGVFGALLDLCARAKAAMPDVALTSVPRMADFATVLAAIDRVEVPTACDDIWTAQTPRPRTRYPQTCLSPASEMSSSNRLSGRPVNCSRGCSLHSSVYPVARGDGRRTLERSQAPNRNTPALRTCGWTVEHDDGRNQSGTFRWTISPPNEKRLSQGDVVMTPVGSVHASAAATTASRDARGRCVSISLPLALEARS